MLIGERVGEVKRGYVVGLCTRKDYLDTRLSAKETGARRISQARDVLDIGVEKSDDCRAVVGYPSDVTVIESICTLATRYLVRSWVLPSTW